MRNRLFSESADESGVGAALAICFRVSSYPLLIVGRFRAVSTLAASHLLCSSAVKFKSGPRNQNFFPFSNFCEACNHPNLYAVEEIRESWV
jgi:hypothetical protein